MLLRSAGVVPLAVETDASGSFLYVANSGSNGVSVYALDPSSGRLSAIATVPTPGTAFSISVGGEGS